MPAMVPFFKQWKSAWSPRRLAGGMFLVYTLLQVYCIPRLSLNYDEGLFAYYGATLLKGEADKDIVLFDSKLPITALNMLPRAAEQMIHPGLKKADNYDDIVHGRYISLLVTLALAWMVYAWTRQLYGDPAALISLAVFFLCPNFLAHGIFVSSDIFACLFTTASFYFLWKHQQTGRQLHFMLAALSVGFAEVSKFSMVHLWIIFPFLLLNVCATRTGGPGGLRRIIVEFVGKLIVFFFVSWAMICAAHLFFDMFRPMGNYQFQSVAFKNLQRLTGPGFRVPFPSSYIRSMDAVMYFDKLGGGYPNSLNGPTYLLGNTSPSGFWYYYFVVLLFKLPIPVILMLMYCLLVFVGRERMAGFRTKEIYLLLPALYYLVYMDFFYSTQLGVRHIMIILPLLYVFTGRIALSLPAKRRWVAGAAIGWQAISVLCWFPHFLPYTNEFLPDKKMVYRSIADTNICYGEGLLYLKRYLMKHPSAVVNPPKPVAGLVIIEVNELLNQNIKTMHRYDWAVNLLPSDHIHSQYLVYDISTKQVDSLVKKNNIQ